MRRPSWHTNVPVIFSILILASFYSAYAGKKPVLVAVSKSAPNYVRWLKKVDSTILLVNMFDLETDSALVKLEECSGLLLTGGEDIHPDRYGKIGQEKNCTEIDIHRDSLEFALIRKALTMQMPIFGICRGEQIMDVVLGGTLIIDIPSCIQKQNAVPVVHQCSDYLKCYHSVTLVHSSLLGKITGIDTGSVTSNHHQAVDRLAPGIRSNAISADGLIEGIEWENPPGKSFLIGVQWHPERMDFNNGLSGKLALEFFQQMVNFTESHKINRQ
jgi:putative glutamine amidotransferase